MLSLHHLHKHYDGTAVVKDVSLELPSGKVIALIGPNGAGKSTVLNMLAHQIKPDHGHIAFKGRKLDSYSRRELAQNLAFLAQQHHLATKLTVAELVAFGRFPYSQGQLTTEDQAKIAQALHFMELSDLAERYLDELSGGQRQRALIAMVLAQDTEYILLDEPTNNLDLYHATKLMTTVRRLCDELGKSVIMVLHDLNYAAFYCDYICAFKDGAIARYGTVDEVMQEDFLREVYQVTFTVTPHKGKPLALHF